jgi:hypothetical protein
MVWSGPVALPIVGASCEKYCHSGMKRLARLARSMVATAFVALRQRSRIEVRELPSINLFLLFVKQNMNGVIAQGPSSLRFFQVEPEQDGNPPT